MTTGQATFPKARILIVDDEPANARLLERIVRGAGYTELITLTDSREVEASVSSAPPDLILLDLRMPYLDGFEVLEVLAPALARGYLPVLVLTADVTREARERALSHGARDFLTKPLDATEVVLRVNNLVETRRLYLRERELVEQTLQGSIRALTDVLTLINPAGFGRATRVREEVSRLLEHLGVEARWEVEVAAMLSQIGSVTLPADVLERHYFGKTLTHAEQVALDRVPTVSGKVVAGIPGLEEVDEILEALNLRFDGQGAAPDAPTGEEIPWGARALKVLLDLDVFETRGGTPQAALEAIRERTGWYDPGIVQAVAEMRQVELRSRRVVEVEVKAVLPGMVLAEDVRTVQGLLLVARGQEVSDRLVERLRNSQDLLEPRQMVHVALPDAGRTAREMGAARRG
jgi:response regulator RpfG family c-di-GMP phosphodiesterase